MPTILAFLCYLVAFALFLIAAAGPTWAARWQPLRLVALGLALWLAPLLWATGEALNHG